MAVSHTALDGSTVAFDGLDDLSVPAVSVISARLGRRTYEFTSGYRGLGRWVADEVVNVRLQETYSLQAGTLSVGAGTTIGGDGVIAPHLVGVWAGKECSVVTHEYWSDRIADVVTLFDRFDIREVAGQAAATLHPRADARFDGPPTVAKRVPDLGIIEVHPVTPATARMLPAWEGTRVLGGELFSDMMGPGRDVPYYILASRSAIAAVLPQANVPIDSVTAQIESLTVEWAAA